MRRLDFRRPHYSRQRGLTVFVVMMAVFMLTSLGAWVIYAAGLANSSSGFQRAASQTQYIAETGILSGTAYFAQGMIREEIAAAEQALRSGSPDTCLSLPAGVDNQFCKNTAMSDIDTVVAAAGGFNILEPLGASMGPYGGTQGYFFVEMTGRRPVFVEGTDVSNQVYENVTLTSYGLVRPTSASLCTGAGSQNATATQMGMRAHAVVGPVR